MTEINLPKIMSEILNVFANRYKNTDKSVIISIQVLKMAQMLTNKRVKYKEFEKIDFPNYYTIVFLPSGGGKDRLSIEYDNFIFKQFRDWFKENAEKYYAKKKQEIHEEYTNSKNKQIKALIKEAEKSIRCPIL